MCAVLEDVAVKVMHRVGTGFSWRWISGEACVLQGVLPPVCRLSPGDGVRYLSLRHMLTVSVGCAWTTAWVWDVG